MADAIEWMHDQHILFWGTILLFAVAVTAVHFWMARRNRRGQLRGSAILLACYLLLRLLELPVPRNTLLYPFLVACDLFFLLSTIGHTFLVVITLVLDHVGKPLPRLAVDLARLAMFVSVLVVACTEGGLIRRSCSPVRPSSPPRSPSPSTKTWAT